MKKLLLILSIITLTSCGRQTTTGTDGSKEVLEVYAEITLFYPDGTTETIEASRVRLYTDSPSMWYYDMDGARYNTNLPRIIDYK